MMKILKFDEFIKESKGAVLNQRTPDRFNSDPLANKKDGSVFDKMQDDCYKKLNELAKIILNKWKTKGVEWLNYDIYMDHDQNTSFDHNILSLEYSLVFETIPFYSIGISYSSLTDGEINYLKHNKYIDILTSNKSYVDDKSYSFSLTNEVTEKMFSDFVENYSKKKCRNANSLSGMTVDDNKVFIIDIMDTKANHYREDYWEETINDGIVCFIEFLKSLMPRIVK